MDAPRKLPSKKEVLATYLERDSARVFLDPRKDGVVVPKHLGKRAELVLRIGLDLKPPIPDLAIGEDAVECTLSFNRSPFQCRLPWDAVFAIISDDASDGRGIVWPEDVPVESHLIAPAPRAPKPLVEPTAAPRAVSEGPRKTAPRKQTRPLYPRPPTAARSDEASDSPRPKRELPPYLRIVK